ncbi:MAG TPA: FAD-dependent oxidoreductase, partial [Candidatus Caenarcaniphilales bacterium]
MDDTTKPTLILGGGFTGLFTALHLSRQHYADPVILIDQTARFIFQPLLYELLSGEMNREQVWPPYKELLRDSGIIFVQDTAQAIDLERRQVRLVSGSCYSYSRLVLALGSTNDYFGIAGAQEHTWSFRTGEDAVVLANHLRCCLQNAMQSPLPPGGSALLTVGVIGAGPTGVELAGTLADLLPDWYSRLGGKAQAIRVVLLNRGREILAGEVHRS